MTTRLPKALACIVVALLMTGCAMLPPAKPVEDTTPSALEGSAVCAPEQGPPFSYRKKVAILAAELRNPSDAFDLPGIDAAWSESLQQRLRDSGRLIVVDASDQPFYAGERQREWIIALAQRLDVQFIVATRLHNLHASRFQLGSGDYAIPSPMMQRHIDAELLIFDGYHGTQIASIHTNAQATGWSQDIINPLNQPVLRGAFLDTSLGTAMNSVLTAQVKGGLNELACLPVMARVIKAEGNNVYVSIRMSSLIHPGDTLQLFRWNGAIETQLGPVEIVNVFPESAVGVYQGKTNIPAFKDELYVRAW